MNRNLKTWLLRFVLVVSSLLVGLALAEGITRAFFPHLAPRTARLTRFWQYDARYGWAHQPGSSGVFDSYGIQSSVTINARGFRGPEVAYAREPQRRRVLVLGDSYVWGYGVNNDEVFTERLRQAKPEWEVVNLGVSGYSTDQELLLYRDEGYKYQADLVLLVLTENDRSGNMLTQQYVVYGKPAFQFQNGALTLRNQPVPPTRWWKQALSQLATQSYVLTAANKYLYARALAQITPTNQPTASAAVRKFPHNSEEELTGQLLVELRREITARQSTAKLLVVCTEDLTSSQELAAYLAPFDIACLDLEQFMKAKDPSLHLTNDFHWNAAGHQKVADILAQQLEQFLK